MSESLFSLHTIFLVSAVGGGTFFLLQFLLQLIGLGGHSDASHFPGDSGSLPSGGEGVPSDLSSDGGDLSGDDLSDSDSSFRFLSLQGLSIFFMIFGLAGLATISQGFLPGWISLPVSLAAGGGVVWIVAKIYRKIFALQSSGNVSIQMALGEEGVVYLTIPPGESGEVQLTVQERLRIYGAVSDRESPIPTGTRVRVVDIINDHTLLVKPVQENLS